MNYFAAVKHAQLPSAKTACHRTLNRLAGTRGTQLTSISIHSDDIEAVGDVLPEFALLVSSQFSVRPEK